MIRHSFVLGLLVLGACFESHSASDNVLSKDNCYKCHKPEYEVAGLAGQPQTYLSSPFHNTNDPKTACSQDCVQCHTTKDWSNFMGACVHDTAKFPLATEGTKHTNIKCGDCHSDAISVALDVTALHGDNTDCIACHPNTTLQANNHIGVIYESGPLVSKPYAYSTDDHRFCLDCHPKGLAFGHGPSNPFILPHGDRDGRPPATCAQCHDNRNTSGLTHQGGADVLCTNGCHAGVCNDHDDGCGSNPNGHHPSCLDSGCHPDGRKPRGN